MDTILEELDAGDAKALAHAIHRTAARLADDPQARGDVEPIVRALKRHSEHPRSLVREAVADVAVHLPDEAYEAVITRLLGDSSAFVKRAATRSYDERSRRQKVERNCEERSADILRLRARIEAMHGKGARRIADQISDRTLEQFVERLLHELTKVTGPLRTAMVGLRAQTKAANGGVAAREELAAHVEEAQGMVDLLIAITAAARSHARAPETKFQRESVRALVEEQVGLLRRRVGPAVLRRLRLDVEIDERLAIEADRTLLAQAVANLLQNAVEAYPDEEEKAIVVRVRAAARKVGGLVAISVEDRGVGIPAKDLERISEPFTSTKGAGRGLGMLNVRKMVEGAHGGTVEIESEVGVGTKVTLVLPRVQG